MWASQYRNKGLSVSVSVAQSLSLGLVIEARSILHMAVHNCMKSGNRLKKKLPVDLQEGRRQNIV